LDANKIKILNVNAITPIESVIYADQTDYWVVGDQGFIVHWMLASYPVYVDSPAGSENLYDVDFVSPNDGWVVGGGDSLGSRKRTWYSFALGWQHLGKFR